MHKNNEKLDIGIQIVNYKTKEYLWNCIHDLLKDLQWSKLNFHIFVVDNNSGDDLSEVEIIHTQNPVSFFYSEKNWWFGYGHNLLAKKHDADYILFVNPDIQLIQKNTIENLYNCIASYTSDITVMWVNTNSGRDHGNKIPLRITKAGISICKNISDISEVARVQWSFFLMNKQIFDQLQWFDENFFLYKEEEDLQLRNRLLWNKNIYNPNISIQHVWGMNSSRIKAIITSNLYFIKKWILK